MALWNVLKISISLKDMTMLITCSSKIISLKPSFATLKISTMPQSNNSKRDAKLNKKRVSICRYPWENLKVSCRNVEGTLKLNSKQSNSNSLADTNKSWNNNKSAMIRYNLRGILTQVTSTSKIKWKNSTKSYQPKTDNSALSISKSMNTEGSSRSTNSNWKNNNKKIVKSWSNCNYPNEKNLEHRLQSKMNKTEKTKCKKLLIH